MLERCQHPLALAPVQRSRRHELLVDPTATNVLLEEPLSERARALGGVLLRRNELCRHVGRANRPTEPHAGEQRLRCRPCLQDDLGGKAPETRLSFAVEAELTVGDVLDDQEAVAARGVDQQLAPLAGEADSRRVLVIRDRVDELWAQPVREAPFQVVDLESVLVHWDGDDLSLEATEGHDRPQISRALDDHQVAAVEERLAHELERLDCAARDDQLVVCRAAALQRFEPAGDRVERTSEPPRGRVLKGVRLTRRGELTEQRGGALTRKRQRVGEATGERDQIRPAEEPENSRDSFTDVPPCSLRKETIPARRLAHSHATQYRRVGSTTFSRREE